MSCFEGKGDCVSVEVGYVRGILRLVCLLTLAVPDAVPLVDILVMAVG